MKRRIIFVIGNFLLFILGFTVLHVMAGAWFDSENWMERPDYTTYYIPFWQYFIHSSLMYVFLLIHSFIIIRYNRNREYKYTRNIVYILIFLVLYISMTIAPNTHHF